jgi:hypothetical protein
MKRAKNAVIAIGLLAFLLLPVSADASWTFVVPEGGTAWQTYQKTFDQGFTGTVGFAVSNVADNIFYSYLLIDNLSQGINPSFETGDYTGGYSLNGVGSVELAAYLGFPPIHYTPTAGSYMAMLQTMDVDFGDPLGPDTSSFTNAYGTPGTNGTTLELAITLAAGGIFSFDWAFATEEWGEPGLDFSLVYFKDGSGSIILSDGLGQVEGNPVPIPPSVLLLAPGLLGLIYVRRFRK